LRPTLKAFGFSSLRLQERQPIRPTEGNPQHPSYPEAHGAIAGACVTVLKAFFSESFVLPSPVVASDDGQSLLPYTGADAGQITVGGELNKLADNVALGRNMAAVHWRSDAALSLLLGEALAISVLRDQRHIYNEPFDGFTFTKFDGTTITCLRKAPQAARCFRAAFLPW
jgi:hypothetical protein